MIKLLVLILTLTLCLGHPIFEQEGGEDSDYHLLRNNVFFTWNTDGTSPLRVTLKLPRNYQWFVLGFTEPENAIKEINEMAWIRVRRKRIVVKNADWNLDGGFTKSSFTDWELDKLDSDGNGNYIITFSRPVEGLKWSTPLKMVYGFGSERKILEINEIFSKQLYHVVFTLNSHKSFTSALHPTSHSHSTVAATQAPTTIAPTTQQKPSTTIAPTKQQKPSTTIALITQQKPSTTLSHHEVQVEHNTGTPAIPSKSSQHQSGPKNSMKTDKKSMNLIQGHNSTIKRKCNVTCNCTKTKVDTHWYDEILKEKENTMYFAIIGGCALLTGILVLCIACCCASGKPKIPKTRKHKVAFYKVDDFDSDAEEEMEFIGKDDK